MLYFLDGETYTANMDEITATGAGTYTVYYKVEGGADGLDVSPRSVEVTVVQAQNAVTDLACPDISYGQTPSPTANAALTPQRSPAGRAMPLAAGSGTRGAPSPGTLTTTTSPKA